MEVVPIGGLSIGIQVILSSKAAKLVAVGPHPPYLSRKNGILSLVYTRARNTNSILTESLSLKVSMLLGPQPKDYLSAVVYVQMDMVVMEAISRASLTMYQFSTLN